jgi:hypothetical protein
MVCIPLIAVATAACGVLTPVAQDPDDAPSPVVSAAPLPAATSFDEYAISFCSTFEALFRAVGNPDTGEGSALSTRLDQAVEAGDGGMATAVATEIIATLESGRRDAARAAGWAPAAALMTNVDQLLAAFQAMTAAKAALARGDPGAIDPQIALEQAGGLTAWSATIEAWAALEPYRPAGTQPCPAAPVIGP